MIASLSNPIPRAGITAVAVSGGADSLYALRQLRSAGHRCIAVHGIFGQYLDAWLDGGAAGERGSNPRADEIRLRLGELCHSLDVRLHIVDCAEAFVERVIRPFVASYAHGRTPNPCALCNAAIKLGLLRENAAALGADSIATGHYARVMCNDASGASGGRLPALFQGADPGKDQSYFLALVPQDALRHTLFPLGETRKSAVLAELARQGLAVPQPEESQEVCFIPGNEYREFLPRAARRLGIALPGPGPILLEDGARLGTHNGLWRHTEGQRRGLGIGWKEPLHVLAKEEDGNILRVGRRSSLRAQGCAAGNVNILLPSEYWPEQLFVKTRYREQPRPARVALAGTDGGPMLTITFAEQESAIAPGQIAAVYAPVPDLREDDGRPVLRLIAGGIIEAVFRE